MDVGRDLKEDEKTKSRLMHSPTDSLQAQILEVQQQADEAERKYEETKDKFYAEKALRLQDRLNLLLRQSTALSAPSSGKTPPTHPLVSHHHLH